MKEDYARLLEAARKLKNWDGPAEVANGLSKSGYTVSEQVISNWKKRGISREGKIQSSLIIGFRLAWIESRTGPMTDYEREENSLTKPAEPSNLSYLPDRQRLHPSVVEVLDLINNTDELGKGMMLHSCRLIAEERRPITNKQR